MRDVNRIDGYCERLAEIWKKVPDWRFGQLMCNLLGAVYKKIGDPFFSEDERMFAAMEEYFSSEQSEEEKRNS